jgi:hypothetical protein
LFHFHRQQAAAITPIERPLGLHPGDRPVGHVITALAKYTSEAKNRSLIFVGVTAPLSRAAKAVCCPAASGAGLKKCV